MQITAAILVALIPALYAFLFLYAYWDPADHLSDVSIAVVNNDKGAVVDGEDQNIGDMLVESLRSSAEVKWVFTDSQGADNGFRDGEYYAELIIPWDFTKCIATAAETDKTQGTLYFKANDKLGTFASSILSNVSAGIEASVSKSITENLADSLTGRLQELPDSFGRLSDSLERLDDASKQLSQGMNSLTQGQITYNSGLDQLTEGLASAYNGSQAIDSAALILAGKFELFHNTLKVNLGSMTTLSNYSEQYNNGFAVLSPKLNTYIDTSSKQLQQCIGIITWLKAYVGKHPESMTDPDMQQMISALNTIGNNEGNTTDPTAVASTLTTALNKLTGTYAQINAAVQKLPEGMKTASTGAGALSSGIGKLSDGSSTLFMGIDTLSKGADTLSEKSGLLLSSEQKILDGLNQMSSGIEQMKTTVDTSLDQMKSANSALEGYGSYLADPVKLEITKIGEAENTGMAMAPFIMSLCLWLGGLMYIIIFTSMEKLKFEEWQISQKIKLDVGLFRFQLLAVIQSVCLAFTVHHILGLRVDNTAQFYGICILGGVAFITVIQAIVLIFHDLGKLLSIIFMLLQITAGGGMMSMALVPSFYKNIHPYMPMTYTIQVLRDNILGMDTSSYNHGMTVLTVTFVVGLMLVVLLSFVTHLFRAGMGKKIAATLHRNAAARV